MNGPIVCVPARNEAARLPDLIRSLQDQTWIRTHKKIPRTVLVLNNRTDESRTVVERIMQKLPEISLHLIRPQLSAWPGACGLGTPLGYEHGVLPRSQ
jgi:glycosyltransferase involved in cell wall biosynthesis